MSGPESRNNAADVSNKEEIKCLFTRVYIPGDEGAKKKKKKRERERKKGLTNKALIARKILNNHYRATNNKKTHNGSR